MKQSYKAIAIKVVMSQQIRPMSETKEKGQEQTHVLMQLSIWWSLITDQEDNRLLNKLTNHLEKRLTVYLTPQDQIKFRMDYTDLNVERWEHFYRFEDNKVIKARCPKWFFYIKKWNTFGVNKQMKYRNLRDEELDKRFTT